MRSEDALILMAKAPLPGLVKTRMRPFLGARRAAEFYSCLLADVAGEAAAVDGVRRYLFCLPPEGRSHFLSYPFSRYQLRGQEGHDLGERMSGAMNEAFAAGARCVVVIGADCPALSAQRIRSAFRELSDRADAVFGPAADGGFYLAGLNAAAPSLFPGIPWSTRAVLQTILSRCRRAGMTYALLPVEADVDTAEDLGALRGWMRAHAHPRCARTRKWLRGGMP
ncbi:MAG: TIGR04282 family arsenosugar biosynthesis glycosyltransferase [Deltaproteobacteria bacterium]|nr:TIGR04282 family arsenosugar biosynthesis glycosyltransferase [Candidatus Deferrimicrobiaceae bacterium]